MAPAASCISVGEGEGCGGSLVLTILDLPSPWTTGIYRSLQGPGKGGVPGYLKVHSVKKNNGILLLKKKSLLSLPGENILKAFHYENKIFPFYTLAVG